MAFDSIFMTKKVQIQLQEDHTISDLAGVEEGLGKLSVNNYKHVHQAGPFRGGGRSSKLATSWEAEAAVELKTTI